MVEMDVSGNVFCVQSKEATQQTLCCDRPQQRKNQPTSATNSAPVSRTLEASLRPNAGRIHAKTGEAVARAFTALR